jgi:predicted metal-dependent hydrolase
MSSLKIKVIRSRRKTMEIQIQSDGNIIVRAPFSASDAEIRRFVEEREDWIRQHVVKVRERRAYYDSLEKFTEE